MNVEMTGTLMPVFPRTNVYLNMRLISCLVLTLTIIGCQSPQKINTGLSEGFNCTWNESRTYQLCLTQSSEDKFPKPITYEIFDKGGNLIRNGKIRSGYVKWIADTDVELFETPGMIPQGMEREDLVRIYQIRSKRFLSKKEYLNLKKE